MKGQGGCKIGFPNSDLKYSPLSRVHVGSIESVHHSQLYSKDPKIERLRMPRCDGLDPLVQNPNQAKNMPRNYFTKPTILLSLQVHMVGVHCHPNDICTIMPPRYRGGRHGRIVSVLILKKEARDRT